MSPVISDLLATTRQSWNLPAVVHQPHSALLLRHPQEWTMALTSPRYKALQGSVRGGDAAPQRMRLCMHG